MGLLAPFVWSAAELLRGVEVSRVKTCGNQRCGCYSLTGVKPKPPLVRDERLRQFGQGAKVQRKKAQGGRPGHLMI